MNNLKSRHSCPGCGAAEVPTLIVRGSGKGNDGVSLRCRRCQVEWLVDQSDGLQAS